MLKFGKQSDPQKEFIVNKGTIKTVSEGDFKIAYDQALSGHVTVTTSPDTVKITIDKDIKGASVYLNTANVPNSSVSVGAGILEVSEPCKNSSYKLASGTLDASLAKARIGVVKAKISSGILSNSTDLLEAPSDSHMSFAHNPFAGFGMTSNIELIGEIEGSVTSFEVVSGTLNFHE